MKREASARLLVEALMKSMHAALLSSRAAALTFSLALAAGCAGGGSAPPTVGPQIPSIGAAAGDSLTAGRRAIRLSRDPQLWSVGTGGSEQSEAIQALDFYPNAITIHAGDTVRWNNPTSIPHTVSIPPAGQTPPPGPGNPVPVGGHVFDNSAYISSGFIGKGQTYSVKFPRPGNYAYYCLLHQPEMTGEIVVVPAGKPLPMTAAQYAAEASADLATDLQAGVASIQLFPYVPGGTHLAAGISPGLPGTKPSESTVMRFLDDTTTNANITVAVGTTVTWTNESNNVPHTVTFPPLGQQPPAGPPDQIPPAGGATYDGSALANSGVMPPGKSYSLTFTKAGTYAYYCLFHDGPTGMIGTVTVQ